MKALYVSKAGKMGGHFRIYRTFRGRKSAISQLRKLGYNYFTAYKDVQGFGLSIAVLPVSIESRLPVYGVAT